MAKIQSTIVFQKCEEAFKAGYTTISLQGGARSSKTYNILIWLIAYCTSHKTRLNIVRKTLPALRGSVLVDFVDIMNRLELYDPKNMNRSDLVYTFENGSTCEFFSCDNEQKLRGRKRDILFVNEANELSFLEWKQLKMRTTTLSILDYNPSFTEEHWISALNADKETFHHITTYKDNPFLEETIIREIESYRTQNKTLWQVDGLGLQGIVEGLIFPTIRIEEDFPQLLKHEFVGMDFGYSNDVTAIVRVGWVDKELYVDELCYKTEMLTSDIIRELKQKCPRMKIISESADPRLVQEIYRAGLNIHPVKKYQGSVEAGLTKMQEMNIHITRRSFNTIKEFKSYTYQQDKEGRWLNTPIDAMNHSIDAIRYVVLNELLGGVKKPIDLKAIARLA